MHKLIFFDLEGPLSPQDNAYEVMGLLKNGYKIFEVISRYDDLLTLEKRKNYEPGDTLALIAPFLVYHKISSADIKKISEKAVVIEGAKELVENLCSKGWNCYIISTSYEQHAYNIGSKIGIPKENTICTKFPIDGYLKEFENEDFSLVSDIEDKILALHPPEFEKDEKIKSILDSFFFKDLLETPLGKIIKNTLVIGGERKVEAVKKIVDSAKKKFDEIVVVGDSITDFKMLKFINENKGLAIVFNGNEYAIPYGTVAVASTNIFHLLPLLTSWERKGRKEVVSLAKELEKSSTELPYYHYLGNKKKLDEIIKIHKNIRKIVRGEAGKLG